MEKQNHKIVINAEGQSLGRLASQIAVYLQDKHKPEYAPNKPGETVVIIENLEKIKPFRESKSKTKIYYKHTGYLGHLKQISLEDLWVKDPKKVLSMAVKGMLPKNKLRDKRLKRLIIQN